ncbi:hypothetical protein HYX19_02830 [Candidatus Woesearchaeota archaeon]|nr:hypothetical protein [Candidatus Woesearchaeota archaeon]
MVEAKELRDKILAFATLNGPILPVQASKNVGTNILFGAAVLSELVAGGKVFFTNMKIGGSPLYYIKGQEPKLQSFINHLSEKPKKACLDLQEKKIIRDHECEAWERVALREIKDFAFPISVKHDDGTIETFWKWYLVNDEEAKKIIESLVVKKEEINVDTEETEDKPKEVKQEIRDEKPQPVKEPIKDEKKERKKKPKKATKDISSMAFEYFEKNSIRVISSSVIKKNKEINYTVEIPSEIGSLSYMVKIKDKAKFTDSDVIIAYSEAQYGRLPMLLLSTGDLTKKAEEYINKNLKGYFLFKKLE